MERQRWKSIVCLLREVHKAQHQWRCSYSVLEIVEIWFWAVIHDRPVSWACQRRSWPIWDHRRVIPSNATNVTTVANERSEDVDICDGEPGPTTGRMATSLSVDALRGRATRW